MSENHVSHERQNFKTAKSDGHEDAHVSENHVSHERQNFKTAKSDGHEDAQSLDWVEMYAIARSILGWSDEEFRKATPRMYFAVLYKYSQIKQNLTAPKQEALVGKDAINALSQLARNIR